MRKELELWQFIRGRLIRDENVMLLVVAESSGSSPGRAGYKMAVAADGELYGSIGGGVMEVNLVERTRAMLSVPPSEPRGAFLVDQVHQKNSPNASGMICSGKQTVIHKRLTPEHANKVASLVDFLKSGYGPMMTLERDVFDVGVPDSPNEGRYFRRFRNNNFTYSERLGPKNHLYIIGGGHCALALSELMAKLDFRITIFDDRKDLNTIEKNRFADETRILDDYASINDHLPHWDDSFVVVMTLGYASDKVVVKALSNLNFKYFGVLGSKAKVATLMKELTDEGVPREQLDRLRTPIGIPINSRTPEEIAVSIAAEIVAVKNGAESTLPRSQKAVRNM